MKQYPHYLYVKVLGGESVQDADGNWVSQPDQLMLHSVCREETNGKGQMINGADGKSIVFSSVIYLPKSAARLKEGTEISVYEGIDATGVCRIRKQVLKFDVGQLGCRLWV